MRSGTHRTALPIRILRAGMALVVRAILRVRIQGVDNFHAAGERVLIVANHVSLIDGALLYLFLPQPPTFAINVDTARRWYFKPFLAFVHMLEMDTLSPAAIKSMIRLIQGGRKAVIFPEGRITTTSTLMKVYEGPGMIADKAGAMILPVGLEGPQYSRLSYLKGQVRQRWLPQVRITILPPRRLDLPDELRGSARRTASAEALARIMREVAFENAFVRETLFDALIRSSRHHGPRRVAVEDITGTRLTYHQMILRSFVLGALIARMTDTRDRVGIMLPSTVAAIVTLFACQARGREAAMLNFTAGPRGLTTAIETAGIKLVFTSRAFIEAGKLQAEADALDAASRLIYLEDLRDQIGLLPKLGGLIASRLPSLAHRLLRSGREPEDPAVIMFTSGSEGIPKGVVLSHTNVLANYAQVSMLIDLTRHDLVLNVLPIFHAFGLLGGLILPLFKGTKSFQYPSPLHYRIIPEICYEQGVTCVFGTATFLRGYARQAHPYDFHKMRFVIAGAEKLTGETRELWLDKFGIRIFEGYGATEASPVIAVNYPLGYRRGSVGQLLTKMAYYLEPVEGLEHGGELVVHGPNVMLGYLFHGSEGEIIPPWTERRGAGWYDTGDIVTVDANGYVSIQGRAKRFAKIGGEMVSLALVEEIAVGLWPDGQHAAIAIPDARKGEQIVLLSDVEEMSRSDLMAAVRRAGASELSIPKQIVYREEIPQLGSGKVDYLALRDLVSKYAKKPDDAEEP